MTTYAELSAAMAAAELAALTPVLNAYTALAATITTAQTELAGGSLGSGTVTFLNNALANTQALLIEANRLNTVLTPPPAPVAPPTPPPTPT